MLLSTLANAKGHSAGEVVALQKQGTAFFLENKGQYIDQFHHQRPDIDFRLKTEGVNIFIGDAQVHYQWITKKQGEDGTTSVVTYRMDVELVGASKNAVAVKEEKRDYRENYYLPQCPGGATANAYGKIVYKNVYPSIDWVLYTSNGSFKYDFVVREGGNINDIKLRYDGDTSLQLVDGKLVAGTPLGNITDEEPYTYDIETKKQIPCNYTIDDHTVGFHAAGNGSGIVIDPAVDWASYFGRVYSDSVFAMTTRFGSSATSALTYIAGETNSFDFFVTIGPGHAGNLNDGNTDAFIAGFTPAGICAFSTLFGGVNSECFRAIACDKAGNLYAAGGTSSALGISFNGHQETFGGQQAAFPGTFADGFFVKFDTNGNRTWASYYGGDRWDIINALVLDNSGNFYIAGNSYSGANIATNNGFQKNNTGISQEAFLAKFNTDGVRQWGTYYGSTGSENATSLACDNTGNVYVAGYTMSYDTCSNLHYRMASPSSFKEFHSYTSVTFCEIIPPNPLLPQPDEDGFIAKFDALGSRLWGTYYGGTDDDYIYSLSYDSTKFVDSSGVEVNGILYLGGTTESYTGIASAAGYQQNFAGIGDGMLAAFTTTGKRYWGTYFGGMNRDVINSVFSNQKGSLFITGYTSSPNLATPDAIKKIPTGATDAFLAVFNGSARQSCTYYGGNHVDYGSCVTIGNNDRLYFAGNTRSWDSISNSSNGAYPIHQAVYSGNITTSVNDPDAFIVQLGYDQPMSFNFIPPPPFTKPNSSICVGDSAIYELKVAHNFSTQVFLPGNVFTLQLSDTNGSFEHPNNLATYTSTSSSISIPATFPQGIIGGPAYNYKLRVVSSRPLMTSGSYNITILDYPKPVLASTNSPLCEGDTLLLRVKDSLNSGVIYHWNGPDTFSSPFKDTMLANIKVKGAGDYRLFVFNGFCRISDTFNVVVHTIPGIQAISNNSPICMGDSLKLKISDTITGLIFNWSGPAGFTSGLQNPVINSTGITSAGKYVVHYSYMGCSNKDSTMVVLKPAPERPTGGSNSPVCMGDTLRLFADNIVTGVSYMWAGPGGYYTGGQTPLILADANAEGTYFVRSKLYDCLSAPDSVKVVVKPLPPVPLVNNNGPLKEGQQLELSASIIAGASYLWSGPNGFGSILQNPIIKKVKLSSAGSYTVLVTVDGCSSSGITIVTVNETAQTFFDLYPNPNKGIFKIKISLERDQVVPLEVVNEAGQAVYREQVTSEKKLVTHTITLPGSLANGVYFLKIRMDGNNRVIPFTLNQ